MVQNSLMLALDSSIRNAGCHGFKRSEKDKDRNTVFVVVFPGARSGSMLILPPKLQPMASKSAMSRK